MKALAYWLTSQCSGHRCFLKFCPLVFDGPIDNRIGRIVQHLADDRTPDTGIAAAFDFNKRRKVIFRNSSAGTSKAPVLDWLVKSTVVPFNRFPGAERWGRQMLEEEITAIDAPD